MDELEALEKLAAQARRETAPEIQVRDRVLARIRQSEPAAIVPLELWATVSGLAAAVLLVLALNAHAASADPLAQLFSSSYEMEMP